MRLLVPKSTDSGHGNRPRKIIRRHRLRKMHILQSGILDCMVDTLQYGCILRGGLRLGEEG